MPSAHHDRMATSPSAPDATGSVPSTHDHRRLLTVLTLGAVAILWAGTAAFLWRDRQLTLQATGEHTARQALRLSQDLEQTLKVARTVINQFDERLQTASASPFQPLLATGAEANAELLAALPLPFELHALTQNGHTQALVGLNQPARRQQADHHHNGDAAQGQLATDTSTATAGIHNIVATTGPFPTHDVIPSRASY